LWRLDRTPEAGTEEIVATLESVIKRDPDHMGAVHYYIHAVESSSSPERALAAANKLAAMAPSRVTWFTCRRMFTFAPATTPPP